jgi:hypothetical protein
MHSSAAIYLNSLSSPNDSVSPLPGDRCARSSKETGRGLYFGAWYGDPILPAGPLGSPSNIPVPPTSSNKFCSFCLVYVYKNAVDGRQRVLNGYIAPSMATVIFLQFPLKFPSQIFPTARLGKWHAEDNPSRDSFPNCHSRWAYKARELARKKKARAGRRSVQLAKFIVTCQF